ncbi:ATP-dependent DNA helicase [Ferroacidibacillus organovorans]|uniref:DNA 5'-3' helicase n=1 Tax=Ferroacidibacillus organovorans TaxID=1765683 RepID=A0A101XST8_9BACL|nr:helicase C-terminal domain-containing protein [Ferroacidibacillus organovorans]KUO96840.1 hypothetical protein ATW55_08510 [Ferroacidibacillus organovorans]
MSNYQIAYAWDIKRSMIPTLALFEVPHEAPRTLTIGAKYDKTKRLYHVKPIEQSVDLSSLWEKMVSVIGDRPVFFSSYKNAHAQLGTILKEAGLTFLPFDQVIDLSWIKHALSGVAHLSRKPQKGMSHVAIADALASLPESTFALYSKNARTAAEREWFAHIADARILRTARFAQKMIQGLSFRNLEPIERAFEREDENTTKREEESLADQAEVILSERLPALHTFSYESRPSQRAMLRAIAHGLQNDEHVVAEAGTGTGKSLAYLIPSLLFAAQGGRRVVVSTHTLALQKQLIEKDAVNALQAIDQEISVTVMKGRNQYLCLRKAAHVIREIPSRREDDLTFALQTATWVTHTETGDREELSLSAEHGHLWREVQSETESCIARSCPFFRHCYYYRARQKAASAAVVITNHALVLSDIRTDHRVLPGYDYLILDEAHHLEELATQHFGAEVSEREIRRMYERLNASRGGIPDLLQSLRVRESSGHTESTPYLSVLTRLQDSMRQAVDAFRDVVLHAKNVFHRDEAEQRITKDLLLSPSYAPLTQSVLALGDTRSGLEAALRQYDNLSPSEDLDEMLYGRMQDVFGRGTEWLHALEVVADVLLLQKGEDAFVSWVTASRRPHGTDLTFSIAPLSVRHLLFDHLFAVKRAVIATSATLRSGGTFQYFLNQTGLALVDPPARVKTMVAASPFDYRANVLLCLPNDGPAVDDPAHLTYTARSIESIVDAAKGRTLVLFTSYQMMVECDRLVRANLEQKRLDLLTQGREGTQRHALIEQFRASERAVLFGVQSFWEGIDIPGSALSCMVIVKLPFAVPSHPVIQARSEHIKKQGLNPFVVYQTPQAVIRFTQGFGRLIRSTSDQGAVFVLDRRIADKPYGSIFLKALPNPTIARGSLSELIGQARKYFMAR